MHWRDFFNICYHPNPGIYIVHWRSNNRPLDGAVYRFMTKEHAEFWMESYWESVISEEFEKEVLSGS